MTAIMLDHNHSHRIMQMLGDIDLRYLTYSYDTLIELDYHEYLRELKKSVHIAKEDIMSKHRSRVGGIKVSRLNSDMVDNLLKIIFCRATIEYEKNFGKTIDNTTFATIAVGGYGRRELSPFSDIDILFLFDDKPDGFLEWTAEKTISLLWDLGFDVGHSSRSVDNCLLIAKKDIATKTSMIESRFIAGNKDIYNRFYHRYTRYLFTRPHLFIDEKIKEMERRHINYRDVICMSEPNLKEGKGGLRDFHTAIWLTAAKFGLFSLVDLMNRGIIDRMEMETISSAYDFVMMIRNELHYISKRKNDHLSQEDQTIIAGNFGYTNREDYLAIELFMKDLYTHLTNLHLISKTIINRCRIYRGSEFKRHFVSPRFKHIGDGFYTHQKEYMSLSRLSEANEIYLKDYDASLFKQNPLLLLKIFYYSQTLKMELGYKLKNLIYKSRELIDDNFWKLRGAKEIFISMLKASNFAKALRSMHEVHILGRFIKEFDSLVYRIHRDKYHNYTIDEHILMAVELLEGLGSTTDPRLKELSNIYNELTKPEIVRLAVLLHDIGKSNVGGHVVRSASKAVEIINRIGLESGIADEVRLLVENHLLMNHIAQRRDMHDHRTIEGFTSKLKNLENLKMLFVLTYADTRSVASDVWTTWKANLLSELFHEGAAFFARDETELLPGDTLISILKKDILNELKDEFEEGTITAYFKEMPDKYIISTPPKKIIKHIRLLNKFVGKTLVMEYEHYPEHGYSEFLVCTIGKAGVFSKIAGTLASKNINILGAQIYTRRDGIAIDTLQVNVDKKPVINEEIWYKIERDLLLVLEEKKTVEDLLASQYTYHINNTNDVYSVYSIPTSVAIHNNISDTHTVIEIILKDKVGVLYYMTKLLFNMGLDIYLAKISTEGNKGINVFYVTDLEGKKVAEPEKLRQRLLQSLP